MSYRTKCKIRTALAVGMIALFAVLLMLAHFMNMAAQAEAAAEAGVPEMAEALSWDYLRTVGGCTAFVLLFVQVTKKLLDKLFYIPTTLYAYVIAVLTMIAATALTGELTLSSGLLTLFNGWLVSATASKSYDVLSGK